MGNSTKKQHNIALGMLIATAIIWGTGFVFGNMLLENGFMPIPLTLNAVRFLIGAIVLIAIFARKIRLTKQLVGFGALGGAMICAAFSLQIVGLKYTTPAACGLFTAAYGIFVPFIAWIFYKKRPSWITFVGVVIALAGLVILNINSMGLMQDKEIFLGNMLALLGSLFFAMQIVFGDFCLHKKQINATDFTVVQVAFCAIFMILAALFEVGNYTTVSINWTKCWWPLAIVVIMGTAFAYFAQTYSQIHLAATETSIILACECPVGAIFSIAIGQDALSWQICVGGLLVIASVVLIEVLPNVLQHKKASATNALDTTQDTTQDITQDTDTEDNLSETENK